MSLFKVDQKRQISTFQGPLDLYNNIWRNKNKMTKKDNTKTPLYRLFINSKAIN